MKKTFSLNYLFASFFGALMIASSFAYYNYKFSEYKFFNFKEHIFYTKSDVFTPKDDTYTVLVYSSNIEDFKVISKQLKKDYPIIAIDLYQHRFKEEDSIIPLSSGMGTLLKFIQRFNIYDIPTAFTLVKIRDGVYKQDSMIEKLEESR